MAGYHLTKIEKGVYGEFSKIVEEIHELIDAHGQENRVMELVELSDLICAIEAYIKKQYKDSVTIHDLVIHSAATQRAFACGDRK
jgi:hypothetical protein